MILRERIRKKQDPRTDELTLGQAISEILMTMTTEGESRISGKTAICVVSVVNGKKKSTTYYKLRGEQSEFDESNESDEFDFLRLWCFARVLQVLFYFYRNWPQRVNDVKDVVRRMAFGRSVPALSEVRFANEYDITGYCIQWMLGRDIPQLKKDFGGRLSQVCAAFAREIDHREPLEDALSAIL